MIQRTLTVTVSFDETSTENSREGVMEDLNNLLLNHITSQMGRSNTKLPGYENVKRMSVR